MKERAIQTVGFLPVGDGEFPHQKKILQGLMDSVEVMLRRSSWHHITNDVKMYNFYFN